MLIPVLMRGQVSKCEFHLTLNKLADEILLFAGLKRFAFGLLIF